MPNTDILIFLFLILLVPLPEMNLGDNWDCGHITYSMNWTLAQLRNITAQCSNGG